MASRGTVLLVEDEPAVLQTTAAILGDEYTVIMAESGQQALTALADSPPDVVCSDYQMPGMDGLQLLDHVAKMPGYIGRVLISGYREHRDRWERRRDNDLFYVLLKPYAPEQLLEVVGRAVSQTRLRRRVSDAASAARRSAAQALAELQRAAATPPDPIPTSEPRRDWGSNAALPGESDEARARRIALRGNRR